MVVTTTDQLEGCKIQKYLGIVSGTDIYLVGGLLGGGLANQENLYSMALKNAMDRMMQKASSMGANAIVGISSNFTSPGGLNNMIVVVTGTAVFAELPESTQQPQKPKSEFYSAPRQGAATYTGGGTGSGVKSSGSWTCSCGRTNAGYVSSCVCGKSKYD